MAGIVTAARRRKRLAALRGAANDSRAKADSNNAHILVSIDQREELFTMADRGEAGQFFAC